MEEQATQESRPQEQLSLSNHLLWVMLLRLLLFVTVLNLLLLSFFILSLFVWAEHCITNVAIVMEKEGFPTEEGLQWLEAGHITVEWGESSSGGEELSGGIPFHKATAHGLRELGDLPFYTVVFPAYEVTVDLTPFALLFRLSAYLTLTVETIFIFSNIFGTNRSIRRSLRPIEHLAATAARLNASRNFGKLEMDHFVGELDKINAKHLDTRIPLSGTEKELQTVAQAINALLDRVEEAYSAQMRFVSDASHELRTPIAVIQGYSAMLDRWGKSNPAALQESIDAIRSEAKSMERLMEQLLFLARGDHQSQPVHKEEVDLWRVIGEVVREEEMVFPNHKLYAQWEKEEEGGAIISADPSLLKQLLRILVDNSLKYTKIEGSVWVTLERDEDMMKVTVEDEGMGIDGDALPHIFQRFYRADASRTRQTGGTGLGLSIAYWIATVHQGWFEVVSREEIGTRMSIFLPLGNTS